MGVERGEVPTGPGGQPAAERGELERLREVPQRQIRFAQLVFQSGAEYSGLNAGRSADVIDLQHPIERAEVEADRTGEIAVQPRLHAADHGSAAAERDHGDAGAARPVEHVDDIGLGARTDDEVGRCADVAHQVSHHIAEGLAVCVCRAIGRIRRREVRERVRHGDPRRGQRERFDRGRFVRGEVGVGQDGRDPPGQRRSLGSLDRILDVPPAPPRSRLRRHTDSFPPGSGPSRGYCTTDARPAAVAVGAGNPCSGGRRYR